MNLCPCMPLDKGVKVLAIIDIVYSTLSFGLFTLALVGVLAYDAELSLTDEEKSIAIAAFIIGMIAAIIQILLAVKLYYGAKKKHYGSCRLWFIVTIIIVILNVINVIVNSTAGEFNGASFGVGVVGIIYRIYTILVVFSFMNTLDRPGSQF